MLNVAFLRGHQDGKNVKSSGSGGEDVGTRGERGLFCVVLAGAQLGMHHFASGEF